MKKTIKNSVKLLAKSSDCVPNLCKLYFGLVRVAKKPGFTLPEVIVSFSVLVMVITAATQILVTVLRVNADNVNSLVAYGLAQEGIEAVRFVRDSNNILGLQFDGASKAKPGESVWGEKLFDDAPGVEFFTLEMKDSDDLKTNCKQVGDFGPLCLPLQLKKLESIKDDSLASVDKTEEQLRSLSEVAAATLVYKKNSVSITTDVGSTGLVYFQNINSSDSTFAPTQFHRFIRVESLKSSNSVTSVDKLRVSSVVSWTGSNDLPMQVVLTSELTNWK